MDLYLPGLPDLQRSFAISSSTAQLTVTACILGLAIGQLFAGGISDARGRRRPVIVGMVLWCLTTVGCAAAPTIGSILALRLVQGLGAGVCLAITRAILADLDPVNLMKHVSRLLVVLGAMPVLAPTLGGVLLSIDGWRGLFLCLAAAGAIFAAASILVLPESLPVQRRQPFELRASLTSYRSLLSNRDFALPALVSGAAFGSLFTFLSSSPFVLGTGFGLSATDYGLAFGTVAAGLIGGMQLSPFLAARLGARMAQLAAAGLGSLGSIGLILAGEDSANLAVTLALLFVILATTGTLIPSSSSEAMVTGSQSMGAASGLVGALQFVIGGGVGLVGAHFGVGVGITPLAVTLLLCDGVALGLTLLRRDAASTLAASSPGGASTPAVLTTAGSNR